jgi:hypothetical protein
MNRIGDKPRAIVIVLLVVVAGIGAWLSDAGAVTCPDATNKGTLPLGGGFQDLEVTGPCVVAGTTGTDAALYQYGNVNIYVTNPVAPNALAYLKFADKKINFWAHSILVENKGQLLAGVAAPSGPAEKPLGTAGGLLNIYIWGKNTDAPIKCKSPGGLCGVDSTIWNSNSDPKSTPTITKNLPGGVDDYFYNYNFMSFGTGKDANSFFGSKVIAVSFGGTMKFAGARGASYMIGADTPSNTGTSWVRLNKSLDPQDKEMVVKGLVDWQKGDHIVITSTDYIPGHAEELVVQFASQNPDKTTTVRFINAKATVSGVAYYHNGEKYNLSATGRLDPKTITALGYSTVETRAAVGLLSRSIQIQSAGDMAGELFPDEKSSVQPNYFFGAHSVVRQGFAAYRIQGVSFYQMGQGGEIAHYPVHFHMVRKAPNDTYVKDCSVWDSMTRWITLHATQNVTLQRNVGYKSIGHGYYIEDGAEANNRLYANLGVLARPAIKNAMVNARNVPGILVAPNPPPANLRANQFPYYSDVDQPSVFWIMNGWNDFEYNMASGAGTCGACYWLVPSQNSGRENSFQFGTGPNDYKEPLPNSAMTWRGYSSMQGSFTGANGGMIPTPMPTTGPPPPVPPSIQALANGRAGMAPLYKFVGNSCSSAMLSFVTVGSSTACNGVGAATTPPQTLST